jgi:hypothetical protein
VAANGANDRFSVLYFATFKGQTSGSFVLPDKLQASQKLFLPFHPALDTQYHTAMDGISHFETGAPKAQWLCLRDIQAVALQDVVSAAYVPHSEYDTSQQPRPRILASKSVTVPFEKSSDFLALHTARSVSTVSDSWCLA